MRTGCRVSVESSGQEEAEGHSGRAVGHGGHPCLQMLMRHGVRRLGPVPIPCPLPACPPAVAKAHLSPHQDLKRAPGPMRQAEQVQGGLGQSPLTRTPRHPEPAARESQGQMDARMPRSDRLEPAACAWLQAGRWVAGQAGVNHWLPCTAPLVSISEPRVKGFLIHRYKCR